MKKLLITATCIMLIASGTPSSANAQLGKILKKTTDAAKEAAKAIKDTAGKVQKPETPAPAAAPAAAPAPAKAAPAPAAPSASSRTPARPWRQRPSRQQTAPIEPTRGPSEEARAGGRAARPLSVGRRGDAATRPSVGQGDRLRAVCPDRPVPAGRRAQGQFVFHGPVCGPPLAGWVRWQIVHSLKGPATPCNRID